MFGNSNVATGLEAIRVGRLLLDAAENYSEALKVALRTIKMLSEDVPDEKRAAVVQNMETIIALSQRAERAREQINQ